MSSNFASRSRPPGVDGRRRWSRTGSPSRQSCPPGTLSSPIDDTVPKGTPFLPPLELSNLHSPLEDPSSSHRRPRTYFNQENDGPQYYRRETHSLLIPEFSFLESNSRLFEAESEGTERPSSVILTSIGRHDDLMQEAVYMANEAADTGNAYDVSEILDEATMAARQASSVHDIQDKALPSFRGLKGSISSMRGSISTMSIESEEPFITPPAKPVLRMSVRNGIVLPGDYLPSSRHASVQDTQRNSSDTDYDVYRRHRSLSSARLEFASPEPGSRQRGVYVNSPVGDQWTGRRPSRRFTTHLNLPIPPLDEETLDEENDEYMDLSPRGHDLSPTAINESEEPNSPVSPITSPPEIPTRHNITTTTVYPEDIQHHNRRPRKIRKERRHPDDQSTRDLYEEVEEGTLIRDGRQPGLPQRRSQYLSHDPPQLNARKWGKFHKRYAAIVACLNTAAVGFLIGVYSGMVPQIQLQLADTEHSVILGNVYLYFGLAISSFVFWPLPLLHGRKPYVLASLVLVLPLQFPQAIVVSAFRSPKDTIFRTVILLSRLLTGFILGFANINFFTVLLDLFGASLQSKSPHQEIVVGDDIRRDGGGMGIWLGIWSFSLLGSISIGFTVGAVIINYLHPEWGFYISVILVGTILFLNVITPETRRSAFRRSFKRVVDEKEKSLKKYARGEVKLHLKSEGPKRWFEEVWAGLMLNFKMLFQPGFFILALYLGWIYAQIVLVIVLIGALLSRSYLFGPAEVGLGASSIAIGALLAIPLTKAGVFSRARYRSPRTDSITLKPSVTWSSHLIRRILFMMALPLAGVAYTLVSAGPTIPFIVPILISGLIGFLSTLATTECLGLIMETFDTSDLQPGVNSRHRVQSMPLTLRRRRTNYSSFPRVTAGVFVAQTIGFMLAAVATGLGGIITRGLGSQLSTGITAGILLVLTLLFTLVLGRFKKVQVLPDQVSINQSLEHRRDSGHLEEDIADDWRPVVVGNSSNKIRRMNLLEMGRMSRWTEVRRLNKLIKE